MVGIKFHKIMPFCMVDRKKIERMPMVDRMIRMKK